MKLNIYLIQAHEAKITRNTTISAWLEVPTDPKNFKQFKKNMASLDGNGWQIEAEGDKIAIIKSTLPFSKYHVSIENAKDVTFSGMGDSKPLVFATPDEKSCEFTKNHRSKDTKNYTIINCK